MGFVSRIFKPQRDRAAEAAAAKAAAEAKRIAAEKLAAQQAKEAAEAKKAEEQKFAQAAETKRRIKRRGGAASTVLSGSPLGIAGGANVNGKTLLGA